MTLSSLNLDRLVHRLLHLKAPKAFAFSCIYYMDIAAHNSPSHCPIYKELQGIDSTHIQAFPSANPASGLHLRGDPGLLQWSSRSAQGRRGMCSR